MGEKEKRKSDISNIGNMSSSSNNNGNSKRKGLVQKWKDLPGKTKCDILVTGGKIALTAATLGVAGPILLTDEFVDTTSTDDLSYQQEWALDTVTVDPIDLADNDFNSGSISTTTNKRHSNTKGSNRSGGIGPGSKKRTGSGSRYN